MLATPARHSFSIVELVNVLAIMGGLVAVAAARAYRESDEARANALMSASDEPLSILTFIDSKYDDGNFNTGMIRRNLSSGRPFWCFRVE